MKNQVKCYDKYNQLLSEGDYVDVQKDGVHLIYKKEDNQLYFAPYGEEDKVSSYFSNDMVKCDKVGNWITNDRYEDIPEQEMKCHGIVSSCMKLICECEKLINSSEELKTSEDWQKQFPNPKVLDPDGWNRTNFQYSWFEEKISYEEYRKRLFMSSVKEIIHKEKLNEINKPIGDFIIENATPTQGLDGAYYHYTEVCKLLKKQQERMHTDDELLEVIEWYLNSFLDDVLGLNGPEAEKKLKHLAGGGLTKEVLHYWVENVKKK